LGVPSYCPTHWNLDDTKRNNDHAILWGCIASRWGKEKARAEYHKEILRFLYRQPLEIIIVLCEDIRNKPEGKKQNPDPNIAFYGHALEWLIQRFSFLLRAQPNSTELGRLVLDTPSGGQDKISEYRRKYRKIWYEGFPELPRPIPHLKGLIESDLSICSGNNHQILQLADIAVGCTVEWAKGNLGRWNNPHEFMSIIKGKFWQGTNGDYVLTRGLICWPRNTSLGEHVKEWWYELHQVGAAVIG